MSAFVNIGVVSESISGLSVYDCLNLNVRDQVFF